MENQSSPGGMNKKQESENLQIRQKIWDMIAYALPLIERPGNSGRLF